MWHLAIAGGILGFVFTIALPYRALIFAVGMPCLGAVKATTFTAYYSAGKTVKPALQSASAFQAKLKPNRIRSGIISAGHVDFPFET